MSNEQRWRKEIMDVPNIDSMFWHRLLVLQAHVSTLDCLPPPGVFDRVTWFYDPETQFRWFEDEYYKLIECKNIN